MSDTQAPTPPAPSPQAIEAALIAGDLSHLTEEQRLAYYRAVCQSLKLNPLTRPFEYVRLNGRLVLYATRSCADQLRKVHGVSIQVVSKEQVGDLYVVRVRATTRDGRSDEDIGIVPVRGLSGEALSNALMKAVTKAKRRATLSICGLGWLDETEVSSIPGAEPVQGESAALPEVCEAPEAPATPQQQEPELATIGQRRAIYTLWRRKHQLTDESAQRWLRARYGVQSSAQLTREQASQVIDYLQSVDTLDLANDLQAISQAEVG